MTDVKNQRHPPDRQCPSPPSDTDNAGSCWSLGFGILEEINDPVHVVDRDCRLCFLNEACRQWLAQFGLGHVKTGMNLFDAISYAAVARPEYDQVFATCQPYASTEQFDYRGKSYCIKIRKSYLQAADTPYVLTVIHDVTAEHHYAEALEMSEKKYRLLVENQNELVAQVDAQGRFTYVSPSYCALFGKTEAELMGRTYMPWVHPDDVPATTNAVKSLSQPPYTCYVEQRALTVNGWRWLAWMDKAILDDNGDVESIVAVGRDITDRKTTEQALQRSESRFRGLFDDVPVGLFRTTPKGQLLIANQGLVDILGYPDKDTLLQQNTLESYVYPEDRRNKLLDIADASGLSCFEVLFRRYDNAHIWVRIDAKTIFGDDGQVLYYEGSMVDVTQRKDAEESLHRRLTFEELVNRITSRFVGHFDYDAAIDSVLREMGTFIKADRSYLFRFDDELRLTSNTHEWCATGVKPEMDNLQQMSTQEFPWVMAHMQRGEVLNISDVREIPSPQERQVFEAQDIKAVLIFPLFAGDDLVGMIGFDNIHSYTPWSKEDVTLLQLVSTVLGTAIERSQAEDSLKVSEQQYRAIFETTRDGMAVISLDGKVVEDVNPGMCRLFGFEREEILGNDPKNILNQDNHDDFDNMIEIVQRGEDFSSATSSRNRDDELFYIDVSTTQILYRGKPFLLVVVRDITEHRLAVEELQRSESRNRALIEAIPDMMFRYNRDGIIVAFKSAHGMKPYVAPALFLNRPNRQILPKDVADLIDQATETAFETGQVQTVEYQLNYSGRLMDYEGRLTVCGQDEVLLVVRDITARKAAARELQLLSAAIEQSQQGVVVTDLQGQLVLWNRAFAEMNGWSSKEIAGFNYRHFYSPDEMKRADAAFATLQKTGQLDCELIQQRKDGTEFPCLIRGTRITDKNGHPMAYVGVFQDISALKAAQEKVQEHQNQMAHVSRLSTIGEMASGLAHEINQPLCAISTYAASCVRMLQGDHIDHNDQKTVLAVLRDIVDQSERGGNVIRRMRGFVRKQGPERTSVDLEVVLNDALGLLNADIRNNAVKVSMNIEKPRPWALGDSIQLEQVSINIIRNAIEALQSVPENQRKITIRVRSVKGHMVQVAVKNLGRQVSPETVAHVFDAFYTTKGQGMGLGLSISRSIIEDHGGNMSATANRSGGMTFKFTVPKVQLNDEDDDQAPAEKQRQK